MEVNTYNYNSSEYQRLLCYVCQICPDYNDSVSYNSSYLYYFGSYDNWNYSEKYADYPESMVDTFMDTYCPRYIGNNVGIVGILITVGLAIIVLLSVLGNTLAICILAFANHVRTNFNSFLINLAVSDLVMAIVCIPFTAINSIIGWWPFGGFACTFIVYVQQVTVTVSIYTLMVIGVDRYMAVVHPLRGRTSALKNFIVIAVIWVVSMIMSTAQLVTARIQAYPALNGEIHYVCDEMWQSPLDQTIYELFVIVVIYVIPLCVISYSYFTVIKVLWGRQLPGNREKQRDHRHAKSKRKVTKMLVSIVVVFAVCWLPLHILMFSTVFDQSLVLPPKKEIVTKIYFVFYFMAMANTFVNPFIYTICHQGFRRKPMFCEKVSESRTSKQLLIIKLRLLEGKPSFIPTAIKLPQRFLDFFDEKVKSIKANVDC
ncbi:RYamide receptor-like [Glandiceps talaboti]